MERSERFNSLSHVAGGVLATLGTIVLIVLAAWHDDAWRVVSFSVYGTTLIFLYISAIRIWLCLKAHSRPSSSSRISVFMSTP